MSNDKYSLIIMRDSTQKVRTFRVGAQRLKILIYVTILLILMTVAGIIFSLHGIKKYVALNNEINSLKATLAESEIKLERLHNVQEILNDSEEVARTQKPMDTGPATPPLLTKELSPPLSTLNATEVVANVFPSANIFEQNATAQNTITQNSTEATSQNSTQATNTLPNSTENAIILSPAKISKVDIKARSPKTISVGFDLHNTTQGKTLSGDANLSIITKAGEVVDIVVPKTHMDFQINYYKRMSTTFPLPTGLTPDDINTLQIKITANGKQYQAESFPFP